MSLIAPSISVDPELLYLGWASQYLLPRITPVLKGNNVGENYAVFLTRHVFYLYFERTYGNKVKK